MDSCQDEWAEGYYERMGPMDDQMKMLSGTYDFSPKDYQSEQESTLSDLKSKINNFLFEVVPPTMKVHELDKLADKWHNTIVGAWEHWTPKPLK